MVAFVTALAATITPVAAAAPPTAAPRPGPLPASRPQPGNQPTLQDGFGATPKQKAAMAAAAAKARSTGKPVEVDGLTTETQQVTAQPKGGFTMADNPKPVRTDQHGKWVPVDTTLHRNADGTLSPAATAYGSVALSGGGHGPLATTTSGATTYTVSWPGTLPTPVVSGATATYPEVLPGVDLVASATAAGGFSDVLVVKTRDAAKNPALAALRLATTTAGGKATAGPNGGVSVTGVKGGATLTAGTPLMWDSSTKVEAPSGKNAPRTPAGATIGADPSDVQHAGMAAHIAKVATRTTDSSLTLSPDRHLLTDAGSVFPVYIDPSFNWHPTTGGTPAFDEVKQGSPCTNTSLFDKTDAGGDFGQLAVGVNGWDSCRGIMRTYYQWQLPSVIWGAHIGNVSGQPGATVNATKLYSADCSTTATVNLHWAGGIGPGTSWNTQPGYGPSIAQQSFGPAINPTYCPKNGTVTRGFDVTGAITQSAAAHSTQFTVALTEDAYEASRSDAGFSRFTDNPTLQIWYNLIPNTPGANQLSAKSGADDVGCATSGQYPYMGKAIATNTPVLSAAVTDPDGDNLQADFRYWVDNGAQTDGYSADGISSGGTAQFSLPPSFITGLSNGQTVSWQVRVSDGEDWGGWSPTCHFIAEPTAPSAPSITSTEGKYPSDGTIGAASGTPGRFTVSSTGGQVSKLVDGFDEKPPQSDPPAADVMTPNGSADIAAAGHWKLSEGTGATAGDSAGSAPATLSGTTSWTTDPVRGKVLTLTGQGFAATAGPVVKTDGSFTVSAWVNATSTTDSGSVLGQDSVNASGFYLENIDGKWSFSKLASDNQNAAAIRAESTNPPQVGVWTHLAGVYDDATGKMTLYVNGQAQGTATDSTPYAANGPFSIGRAQWNAVLGGDFKGSISDVQAYQAALSPTDIAKVYAGTQVGPAGRWRTVEGAGTSLADASGNNHPITLTGGGVGWTLPTDDTPAVTFADPNGYGATSGPVLDTTQSFTVSAWAKVSDLAGYYAVVGQNATHVSAFQIRYSPDVKAWIFGMPSVDATGDHYQWAYTDNTVSQANVWTHVAGVYDAKAHQISLYVNGALLGQKAVTSVIPASGPFLVGATLFNDGGTAFMHGAISDVQAYQTALSGSEIAEMAASATRSYTPKSPGPHTLYAYAADQTGDTSGTQAYRFYSSPDPNVHCTSLAACLNNVSVSPDDNMKLGDADGGNSFSANALATEGWVSGGNVTVDGATFTLPQFGSGQADNVLAANQTVDFHQDVSATGSSALEFLATATTASTSAPGAINGDTTAPYVPAGTSVAGSYCFDATNPGAFCAPQGTINYTDGTSQPYFLTVPDWITGPATLSAIALPGENQQSGSVNSDNKPKIYPFSVPLAPGKTIASVTLPDVGSSPATQALHIYGLATRDTTVAQAPAGKTWTATWGSPNEGVFNFGQTFGNQTFREIMQPSLAGDTVRVKFDNSLGITSLRIDHATVAPVSGTSPSPVPSAAPTDLKFATSQAVTVPAGGMAYSDPLPFPAKAGQYLMVSFQLDNQVQWMPMDVRANSTAYQYVSAAGSGDQTADTTGTPFASNPAGANGPWTSIVANLDVTGSGVPTQAVLGDGYVDQAQTGKIPSGSVNLSSVLNAAESTTPAPYGSIEEGVESNQVMKDYPEANGSGPSLLSRIDRDVLDQPGLSTVVLDEGLEDVLGGRSADDLTANGLTALINYFQADGIAVVAAGLTPCDGYAGDGATPNDACTADVDKQRVAVNQWLSGSPDNLGPWTTPPLFYLNSDAAVGVPDTANGEVKLNPAADSGDHVNLTNDGFAALASAYLGAQDTWLLGDGTSTSDVTIAADSANLASNQYLLDNPAAGNNPATLAGGASWATDATRGTVLNLDGVSGAAVTPGPALTTTGSFTVSAWVKPSSLPSANAAVIAEDGQHSSAFYLFYNATAKSWSFSVSPTDTPTVANLPLATAADPAAANTWTHLVGVYDAATQTEQLFVDGTLAGQVGGVSSFAASGPLSIGRDRWNDAGAGFFPGEVSDAQAWNYALTPTQVSALYHQVN